MIVEEILLRTWRFSAVNYSCQLLLKSLRFIHLCLGGWAQSFPKQLDAKIVKTTAKISSPAHIFRQPVLTAARSDRTCRAPPVLISIT